MKVLEKMNPHVNAVNPYQPGRPIEEVARELGLDPDSIIKLASNESALGVAPSAVKVIQELATEAHIYPDGGAYELREKLAQKLEVAKENLIFGAGSNEILVFLSQCLMGEGKSVVASEKAFVIYKILSLMTGTDFIEVPTVDLGHDLQGILDAIREDTTLVFVCNPNNPTGTLVTPEEVNAFMAKVPDHVLVVFDEAYAEICLGEMPDTIEFVRQNKNVLVLRTFSKAYGLAGIRIGYGIGAPELIQCLEKPRQPFNTTILSQAAAVAALDDDKFLEESIEVYAQGKAYCCTEFEKLGLSYVEPFANFVLFEVPDGAKVNELLTAKGVIVRPMAPYGLPNHLRVTFGTVEQNEAFIQALAEVLKDL